MTEGMRSRVKNSFGRWPTGNSGSGEGGQLTHISGIIGLDAGILSPLSLVDSRSFSLDRMKKEVETSEYTWVVARRIVRISVLL